MLSRLQTHWPWLLVLAGYIAAAFLLLRPFEALLTRLALLGFSFYAIQFSAVFLHELGHLIACVLLRELPATLQIGTGPLLKEFKCGPVTFRFNSTTNSGLVTSKFHIGTFNRSDFLCLYASGPFMDLLSLGGILWCLVSPPKFLLQLVYYNDQIKPLLIVTGCYLFYYHLSYLTRPASFSPGEISDAGGLTTLWPVLAAPDHIREAFVRLCNETDERFHNESTNEVSAESGQDLQTYYDWALQQPKLTPESVLLLKDSFITSVILCGYTALLSAADSYSSELLATEPNSLTYKGSRGAVLVDLGQLDAGKTLLHDVFVKSSSITDRTISAAFLAIAEHRLGNMERAEQWLSTATELNPLSAAVIRAQRELRPA